MPIDRSKFKASRTTALQQADSAIDAATGRKGRGAFADMLEIKDGRNMYRIFPTHDDGSENPVFAQAVVKVFLPMMVPEKDADKKEIPDGRGGVKKKEGSKPVFNSRIHGETEKDLIDEYIKIGKKIAEEDYENDPVGKQKFLDKLVGKFSPNPGDRLPGVSYKTTYQMYAQVIVNGEMTGPIGRLEVKPSVKEEMNRLGADEEADEAMGVDPFTDPDDGRALVIVYDSKAKKASDYYNVSLDTYYYKDGPKKGQVRFFPLTDEQLEGLNKLPSLKSLFKGVFKRKDFLLQVEGLEFFDNKYGLGITASAEWEKVFEEIEAYYPEEGTEGSNNNSSQVEKGNQQNNNNTVVENNDDDEYANLSRAELKAMNTSEKLGIIIKPTMTDDTLREEVKKRMETKTPIEEVPLPGEPGYKDSNSKTVTGGDSKSRLDAIKNRTTRVQK